MCWSLQRLEEGVISAWTEVTVVSYLVSAGKNQACALSCGTISSAPRHISFDITDKIHILSSICSHKSDEFGRCHQVTDE